MTDKTLIGFDLETTGTNTRTARIVTANITVRYPDGEELKYDWLIDPGVEIPEGAAAVHGITTEHAQEHGQDPKEALDQIADTLREYYDHDGYIVIFNAGYDLPLLKNELKRHGLQPLTEFPIYRVYDPLVIDRTADKYRRGSRKLVDMCPVYGVEVSEDAHQADEDVRMTLDLIEKMLQMYQLPEKDLELYELQAGAHREWAESFGQYLRRQGKVDDVNREWIG